MAQQSFATQTESRCSAVHLQTTLVLNDICSIRSAPTRKTRMVRAQLRSDKGQPFERVLVLSRFLANAKEFEAFEALSYIGSSSIITPPDLYLSMH